MISFTRRSFVILGSAGALSACSATSAPFVSVAAPVVEPVAVSDPGRPSESEIIAAINGVRRANGASPWSYNRNLERAAQAQANLMVERGKLSHDLGVTLRQRVTAAGYEGAVGENVAGGQQSLQIAIEGWMKSSGHRQTLLSEKFVEFGLAVAHVPASSKSHYRVFWAMIAGGSYDAWRVYS